MYAAPIRQVTAWLSDATHGVNALLATVPKGAGDAAPGAVSIYDAVDTEWVARGTIDRKKAGNGPLLLVGPPADGTATVLANGEEIPSRLLFPVAIRYVIRDADVELANYAAWQTLRAAIRSLFKQASRTTVVREGSTIGPLLGMQHLPGLDRLDDDLVIDVLLVTLGVVDQWALAGTDS